MAGDQRRLAYASKRDSTSMKTISLLGSIFLPATLLASIFSMTFFNFQNGKPKHSIIRAGFREKRKKKKKSQRILAGGRAIMRRIKRTKVNNQEISF